MPTIDVDRETYDRLAVIATTRRTTVEQYVMPLLATTARSEEVGRSAGRHLSDAEFEQVSQALSAPLPPTAVLPDDFSRADVYLDHD